MTKIPESSPVFTRPNPLSPEEVEQRRREAISGARPQQIQASLLAAAVAQLERIADALEKLTGQSPGA